MHVHVHWFGVLKDLSCVHITMKQLKGHRWGVHDPDFFALTAAFREFALEHCSEVMPLRENQLMSAQNCLWLGIRTIGCSCFLLIATAGPGVRRVAENKKHIVAVAVLKHIFCQSLAMHTLERGFSGYTMLQSSARAIDEGSIRRSGTDRTSSSERKNESS